jgi:hypothetical protein
LKRGIEKVLTVGEERGIYIRNFALIEFGGGRDRTAGG